jgi:hypothetical protein
MIAWGLVLFLLVALALLFFPWGAVAAAVVSLVLLLVYLSTRAGAAARAGSKKIG